MVVRCEAASPRGWLAPRRRSETRTTLTAAKASGGTFDAPRVPILSPPVNRGKEESAGKRRTTRGGRKPGRELGRAQLMTAMECDGKVGRGGREGSSKRQSRRQTVAHGNAKRSSKREGITAELRSLLGASQRGHRGKWETCNGACRSIQTDFLTSPLLRKLRSSFLT